MLSDEDRRVMRTVAAYLDHANTLARAEQASQRTPLGDIVSEHLGTDASAVAVVQEMLGDHRLVDADTALEMMTTDSDGRLVGISGGEARLHVGMPELMSNPHTRFAVGPVDYAQRATGPDSTRRVVAMGLRLLHHDGVPLAVVQRAAVPHMGRGAVLEVIGADPDAVSAFLDRLRALMVEHSVLRGQVLSFVPTEFGHESGATFLTRPEVAAGDVVLPAGVLDEVVQHVVGIGEHRALLREAGQHLKRGVLLYGPPGTGKTLTVRHLLARTPGVTAVLLTGASIRFISAAAEIARTFQPSVVVLEDIDLVAMERHASPQPLLFEVLEALDGLDGDADVAFVMTTNRVEVLERALAERPGRVDLAVEVPLPALRERAALLRLYAHGLGFTEDALDDAARRAEGTTGSFAKELVRRSVLFAASAGHPVGDEDLRAALDELLSARGRLTRALLGTVEGGADEEADGDGPGDAHGAHAGRPNPDGSFGWFAYSPLHRGSSGPTIA